MTTTTTDTKPDFDARIDELAHVYLEELSSDDALWELATDLLAVEMGVDHMDLDDEGLWRSDADEVRFYQLSSEVVAHVLARAIVKSRSFNARPAS